jgi:hypothetical protein
VDNQASQNKKVPKKAAKQKERRKRLLNAAS